ncbi:addiction module protein [Salinisphaera sp. P385]|uniref:Addiction module protein n=1 Tax=Spectribacter acetivorans TaxID=3075603 RepID=A0ABU3B9D8_9GAMM|nr:addiction module protein [Salinisphaera sp. P385]MDT0617893.1 addiction module protein [Salinisphaera sp. P385]
MKPSPVEIEALQLPAEERAKLAQRLLESLESLSAQEAENLWIAEAARRAREIDEGVTQLVSADELERRVEARLK